MKGLVFYGKHDLRYEDVADPVLRGPDSIVVKIKKCGLCGSDLHFYNGHPIVPGTGYCMGHEAVGEVVEKGSDVKTLNIGDDVMLSTAVRMGGCGKCWACLAGKPGECGKQSWKTYGIFGQLPGCQADGVEVIRADMNVSKIPEGISLEQAVLLTDNLGTAWMGCKNAEIGPGKEVAIVGLGPIGLMAVEIAFIMGASKVYAIDLVEDRRNIAKGLGAIALDAKDALPFIKDATDGVMLPCVVEGSGSDKGIDLAIRLAKRGGVVSVFGVNQSQEYKFPIWYAFNHRLTFRVSGALIQTFWPEIIPLIQQGRLKPEKFITHRLPLKDALRGYEMSDQKLDGALKFIFTP